jgi:methionyl-tRNA formyltransferase
MNLLLLGEACIGLSDFFKTRGDVVIGSEEKVAEGNPNWIWMDYAVSFGYRHILPAVITRQYSGRILNIHISYLPWNRGADPNLWSFLEDTPKGVSIHLVDESIDTGPLLAREKVQMLSGDTLASSYHRLEKSATGLLKRVWPDFINGSLKPQPQETEGTSHASKDKIPWLPFLTKGWETPICELERKAIRD